MCLHWFLYDNVCGGGGRGKKEVEGVGKKEEEGGGEEEERGEERAQGKLKGIGKWLPPVTTSLQGIPEYSKKDGFVGKGQKDT